jgi:hypothetical protein
VISPQQAQTPPSATRLTPQRLVACYWFAFRFILFLPLLVLFFQIYRHWGSWTELQTTFSGFSENIPYTVTHYGSVWFLSLAAALTGFAFYKWRAITTLPPGERAPFHWRVFLIRVLLLFISVPSLFFALTRIAKVVDMVVLQAAPQYPDDDGQVKDTIMAAAVKAAVSHDFDRIIQESLKNGDYERARVYVEMAEFIPGRGISAETRQLYDDESTWTATIWREGLRCGKAAVLGTANSITEVGCMAATDFINTPALITVGDARDITKWLVTDDADPVITTLAVVGAALSVWPVLHTGSVAAKNALKASTPLKLSPRLTRIIRNSVTASYDVTELKKLGKSSGNVVERLTQYASRPAAQQAKNVFGHTGDMYLTTRRFTTPIYAMKYADDVTELAFSARIARLFGKHTDGVFELLGKRLHQIFKVARLSTKIIVKLTGWMTALIGAMAGLVVSMSETATRWIGRRLLFRWLRLEETRWLSA